MSYHPRLSATALLALSLGGCADEAGEATGTSGGLVPAAGPVAIVRTTSLQWEGEQTYIPLYADGAASGLVVVNFAGGQLFGTTIPDAWTWLHADTVEICGSVNVLRNEVDFMPRERECAPHPISGKELDLDGDGDIDLVETFTVLDESFYSERPGNP